MGFSRAGKTTYAESLFEKPFVITVEDNPLLDLKGFDREEHDGIVLDNCNSFQQLLAWRAVLQSRNARTKGGQSATQMYAYSTYVFMVPVVATVDFDAPDAHLVERHHEKQSRWLVANTVVVRLDAGDTFYVGGEKKRGPAADSLFARNLRRGREVCASSVRRQDMGGGGGARALYIRDGDGKRRGLCGMG